MQRKKVITAGTYRREVIYTPPTKWDTPQQARERRGHSSEARKKMNDKTAKGKLKLLLAANFGPDDYLCTFTYRDEDLPSRRKTAYEDVRKYFKTLRTVRRARGEDLKYVYVIEHKHGAGRWHVHAAISRSGKASHEEIKSIWTHGDITEVKPFRSIEAPGNPGYKAAAEYLAKEGIEDRPLGTKMWAGSRNLTQPTTETYWVSDNATIRPPKGSHIVERDEKRTEYGRYQYCEYILPAPVKPRKHHTRKQGTPSKPPTA